MKVYFTTLLVMLVSASCFTQTSEAQEITPAVIRHIVGSLKGEVFQLTRTIDDGTIVLDINDTVQDLGKIRQKEHKDGSFQLWSKLKFQGHKPLRFWWSSQAPSIIYFGDFPFEISSTGGIWMLKFSIQEFEAYSFLDGGEFTSSIFLIPKQ